MKKSYRCKKLETTLHFLPKQIKFCCSCAEGPYFEIANFNQTDKKTIEKAKSKFIKKLASGKIPKECIGCIDYKETPPKTLLEKLFIKPKEQKIQHIIVDHFKQCDCNCIYCSQKIIHKRNLPQYNILPIIQQLYKQDMIDRDNLLIEFQGGNVSMLEEFGGIIEECLKNQCQNFKILTNGIKYLPELEKIKDNNSSVSVSLDCGTRETFAKIKNIDAFDAVIANLNRIKENTNLSIELKYIIIKDVNDNIEEVKSFLNTAKTLIRNRAVIFDIDYRDIMINRSNNFKVPANYYEIMEFVQQYSKENFINYNMPDFAKSVMAKGNNQI